MNRKIKKNKKRKMKNRGFTMIELIMVIVVLGILAITALPMFTDVSSNAKTAARDGVIGSVKSGINVYRTQQLMAGNSQITPTALDALTAGQGCSTTNTCFSNVLQDPVTTGNWQKSAATAGVSETYTWSPNADGSSPTTTCVYTVATGLLNCN